jgi:hypothetical protein
VLSQPGTGNTTFTAGVDIAGEKPDQALEPAGETLSRAMKAIPAWVKGL